MDNTQDNSLFQYDTGDDMELERELERELQSYLLFAPTETTQQENSAGCEGKDYRQPEATADDSVISSENVMDLSMDEETVDTKETIRKAAKLVELMESASLNMKLNENEVAVEMLSNALELDPDKQIIQAIYFQRAYCKFNMDEIDEAFDDYLRFEALQNQTGMIMDGIRF